jgi:translation initiation factor 1 (eIF-1/SUI1)
MGTGARVEEGRVIVQGDLRDRVAEWLQKQGAKRVIVS